MGRARTPVTSQALASRGHASYAEVLQRAINHGLEFVGVFDFAAFGQDHARSFCIEPGGVAVVFLGTASLADVHQKSFDHVFLHAAGLPEDALGVNVDVEMAGLDDADGARFFLGFAFRGLAVREAGVGGPPWETAHLLPPLVLTKKTSA